MSKHTPGPWRVVGAEGYATSIWGPEAQDVVSASAPMRQEDARLIAAAPDLLEALEALERVLGATEPLEKDGKIGFGAYFDAARAAIAKARGTP